MSTNQDHDHDEVLRALFAKARESWPLWSHTSLMHRVWPKRPRGAKVLDVLRIAEEFKRDEKAA